MKLIAIAIASTALSISAAAWAAAPDVAGMHVFGHCAAQRAPKDVTYLLDRDFRSGGCNQGLKALAPAFNGCLKGKKLGAGGTQLRAVLALAAFRSFRAAGG